MKATVYADKDIIGKTDLCIGDFTMGGLYGMLYPTDFLKNEFQDFGIVMWWNVVR